MAKKEVEILKTKKGSFLADFNKQKVEGVAIAAPAPKYWLDSGSYIINKVMSGSYNKGWASGRLAALAGPSGSGKSFLLGAAIKSALTNKEHEWGVLVVDSERALTDDYLTKIGCDIEDNPLYTYRGVVTISQAVNVISNFTASYRKANEDMPFLIAVDSLDMMQTDSENEQYLDGEIKGDQGQHAKQTKALLKRLVNDIGDLNIVLLSTKQVFQEQDKIAAYNNPWRITESSKFAFSQLALVTKLMMKDDDTKKFEGIHLKVRGEKTRFAKPFQQAMIEVPYDIGMDPYSGILEAAVSMNVVTRPNKMMYEFDGQSFKKSKFDEYRDAIFAKLIEKDSEALNVPIEGEEDLSDVMSGKEVQLKRKTLSDGSVE